MKIEAGTISGIMQVDVASSTLPLFIGTDLWDISRRFAFVLDFPRQSRAGNHIIHVMAF